MKVFVNIKRKLTTGKASEILINEAIIKSNELVIIAER